MPILVDSSSRILCMGMTSVYAKYHIQQSLAYGANIVCGVEALKAGQEVFGRPIFSTVREAKKRTHCDVALIFVPKEHAAEAIIEAAYAQIRLIICLTGQIPLQDMTEVFHVLKTTDNSKLLGPNTPGIISPGRSRAGRMPGYIHTQGVCGIVSSSETLMYEAIMQTTANGLGQSSCVGLGNDPMIGMSLFDILEQFYRDPFTEVMVAIASCGQELLLAEWARSHRQKPLVAYVPMKQVVVEKKPIIFFVESPTAIGAKVKEALASWKL